MLYIIKKEYFLADYILDALAERDDIRIITHKRVHPRGSRKRMQSIRKYAATFIATSQRKWDTTFFESDYLHELSQIQSTDQVLFWGVENLKDLLLLQHYLAPATLSVFLWNPIRTISRNKFSPWEYAHYLHKNKRFHIYTFDAADAVNYRFSSVPQVYRRFPLEALPADKLAAVTPIDFFFVGRDKSRSSELVALVELLQSKSMSYYFHIVQDKHTVISPHLASCFKQTPLSYSDTLLYLAQSKCLIEFVQKGQQGLTIRALEALFYQKKLVTNNGAIRDSVFYHRDNIFIWGEDRVDDFERFMHAPYHEVENQYIQTYDIEYWIKRFL